MCLAQSLCPIVCKQNLLEAYAVLSCIDNEREGAGKRHSCKRMTKERNSTKTYGVLSPFQPHQNKHDKNMVVTLYNSQSIRQSHSP